MATLWGTSDEHFFHENIGRYCNRPDGWQELIIANRNAVVQPDDWVLDLGDFAFGRDATRGRIIEVRKRLNGHIILGWGNHDRLLSQRQWREMVGIDAILHDHESYFDIGQYRIVWLHERPQTCKPVWGKSLVYASHAPILNQVAMPYFYGHVHNNHDLSAFPGRCLCVEVCGYSPVRLGALD